MYKLISKLEKEQNEEDLKEAFLTLKYLIDSETEEYEQVEYTYGIDEHTKTQQMKCKDNFSETNIEYLTQFRTMNNSINNKYYWDYLIIKKDSIEYNLKTYLDEKIYIELNRLLEEELKDDIKEQLINKKYALLATSKELEKNILLGESLISYNASYLNPGEICVATNLFKDDIINSISKILELKDEEITDETYFELIKSRSKLLMISPIVMGKILESVRFALNISYLKDDTTNKNTQSKIRQLIEEIFLNKNSDIKQFEKK